ncbi:MAG: hypothetical protein KatS3mg102_0289 [Planctomycetota bacterium]|nr:MAG: hypothetical protein KatS3mg102_0289 [Planctomycetota bacterium]
MTARERLLLALELGELAARLARRGGAPAQPGPAARGEQGGGR